MKKQDKKTLVLLDSHAILHRAYHALPDFSSSKGEPTGALYGVSTMLIKIISDLKPDYIVACFDLADKTYRHEAYENYKAGRSKADDELITQIKRSYDLFNAFGIPMYSYSGFEADDMLGTIVEQTKDKDDLNIIIASGDMDTLQLVSGDKVKVFTLKKGIKDTIIYNEKNVIERFGFGPKLIPDYKGLRGDPSDNIIGIKGIGEKTATDLIVNFGTIENIYKTLKKDEDALLKKGIKPRIIDLLKQGEEEALFSKMLATIRIDAPIEFKLPEEKWVDNVPFEKIKDFFLELEFRTLADRLRMALGVGETKSLLGEEVLSEENIDSEKLIRAKIGLWVLDSNITEPTLENIFSFAKTKNFENALVIIENEIEKRGLAFVFNKIEIPLVPIVAKMKDRGVKIDTDVLKNLSKEYTKELESLEKNIFDLSGKEFNIKSPKQLGGILYDDLGIKPKRQKKTGTGQRSTAENELQKMADLHPIIKPILEYRELQKLLSTYIDNIPTQVSEDGRLRATFLQTGTTTGRMSSKDPNLQNIPIKTELGRHIRKAFVAENGFSLVALDYSQVELRIAAFLSEDKRLISAFVNGEDIHSAVASEVFGVPIEKVDKEMRRRAKVINFGILYGMGVNALRQNLGENIERSEAQQFYDTYFEKFSGLANYIQKIKAEAERKGYTETVFGRRRYFEGFKSKLPFIRAQAERMAINAPIQGTQADLIKLSMLGIDEYISSKMKDEAFLILQIHDEVIYEVSNEKVSDFAKQAKKIMEGILVPEMTKGVPIIANASFGKDWGDMKEIK